MYFDARWGGTFGIGRYSKEIRTRIADVVEADLSAPGHPVSGRGIAAWEAVTGSRMVRSPRHVLFSPAFTPSRFAGARQAITVHDLIHLDVPAESSRSRTLYYDTFVRPAVRRSPVTFTVSEYSKRRLVEWAGVDPDRVVVTGNAASAAFSPSGDRHDPGFSYVLCVSNSKPHKNLGQLVREFAGSQVDDIHLVLTGSPDESLAATVEACGVSGRVHWTGLVDEERLPALYRGAELFVLPSVYEGFGIPLLEAMACGVPVIAADRTALPEVVADAGVLVDTAQDGELADAIRRVHDDPAERARMARAGLQRAAEFSWDRIARRVEDALRDRF